MHKRGGVAMPLLRQNGKVASDSDVAMLLFSQITADDSISALPGAIDKQLQLLQELERLVEGYERTIPDLHPVHKESICEP